MKTAARLRRLRLLALPLAAALFGGCESTNIAPAMTAGAPLEEDEARLWARAREEEEILDHSGFVYHDAACEEYLNSVLRRLDSTPLGQGGKLQIKILVDPRLNAFALPNGDLYIHTGLVAAIQNEAQLATVLGHELTHATHRHALKGRRDLKNKSGFAAAFGAGTMGVGAIFGTLGAISSVTGYEQSLEREADMAGFQLMVQAGYDPREAPKVFQLFIDESRRSKIKEPYFFGSHPRLTERVQSYQQLLAALPSSEAKGRTNGEEYDAHIGDLLIVNAEAAQVTGDVESALGDVQRALRIHPDDIRAQLLLAETHRKRDAKPDEAVTLYRQFAARHPDNAEGHRGLGLALFAQGDREAAAASFRRYLQLQGSAPDRLFVESLLQQCASKP